MRRVATALVRPAETPTTKGRASRHSPRTAISIFDPQDRKSWRSLASSCPSPLAALALRRRKPGASEQRSAAERRDRLGALLACQPQQHRGGGMAERDRERVGGMRWRRRLFQPAQRLRHPLHLVFVGTAVAADGPLQRAGGHSMQGKPDTEAQSRAQSRRFAERSNKCIPHAPTRAVTGSGRTPPTPPTRPPPLATPAPSI
jgi:hypothetical protein